MLMSFFVFQMAQISHLLLLILATGACSAQDQWRPITERLVTLLLSVRLVFLAERVSTNKRNVWWPANSQYYFSPFTSQDFFALTASGCN
jgi:hypothetical protein